MHVIENLFNELKKISSIPQKEQVVTYSVVHHRKDRTYNIIFRTKSGKQYMMKKWINDDDMETSYEDGHLLYQNDVINQNYLREHVLGFTEISRPEESDMLSELVELTFFAL